MHLRDSVLSVLSLEALELWWCLEWPLLESEHDQHGVHGVSTRIGDRDVLHCSEFTEGKALCEKPLNTSQPVVLFTPNANPLALRV
jgi:hypothetical protein